MREKTPFFLLAIIFGVIALMAQREAGALKPLERHDVSSRLAQAFFGLAFYLWKSVFPLNLSPLYELPLRFGLRDGPFAISAAAVVAISVGLYLARRRWPAGAACWVYYVVALAPVLGFAQSGSQLAADRYSYLSCLGWALLVGAGLFCVWRARLAGDRRGDRERSGAISVPALCIFAPAVVVLFGLGILTWRQVHIWRDSDSLWRRALAIGPSRIAHEGLALVLRDQGRMEEAMAHYRRVIELDPLRWHAHYALAVLLEGEGRRNEAVEQYRSALRINPSFFKGHYNLGMLLADREAFAEATEHLREALRLDPADANAHYGLAVALSNLGRLEEAVAHLREAVKIKPDLADAHRNLGQLLAARGNLEEAVNHFHRAVNLEPDFAEAHESLGRALALLGRKDEAARHLQEAVRILQSRGEAGRVP